MVRVLNQLVTAAVMLAACGTTAWAHPGHGVIPPDEPAHWLEPLHLVPLVLAGVGAGVLAFKWIRRDSH